jgi:hypothetical protein
MSRTTNNVTKSKPRKDRDFQAEYQRRIAKRSQQAKADQPVAAIRPLPISHHYQVCSIAIRPLKRP